MLDGPGAASRILREAGLTHDKLMDTLVKVRGNQRVTSSIPRRPTRRSRSTDAT